MKILLLFVFVALLQGCSSLGEVEALNDVGLEDERETIQVFHKTMNVLGITSKTRAAPVINRAYGHAQNMRTWPDNRNEVPYVVRDWKEAGRYLDSLTR